MITINKIEIALNQLKTAIELFNKKNYISAITLAGASEEILSRIAEAEKGTSAVRGIKKIFDFFADYTKKDRIPYSKIRKEFNQIKNELKHNNSGTNETLKENFEHEAVEFILGAIMNYEVIFGETPNEPEVKEFLKYVDSN
jgi:hypothetical protein